MLPTYVAHEVKIISEGKAPWRECTPDSGPAPAQVWKHHVCVCKWAHRELTWKYDGNRPLPLHGVLISPHNLLNLSGH